MALFHMYPFGCVIGSGRPLFPSLRWLPSALATTSVPRLNLARWTRHAPLEAHSETDADADTDTDAISLPSPCPSRSFEAMDHHA